jgi:nucleotide-binding universal stress UspA family protein
MFQRILVPIDFSDCAIRALRLAVEIASTSSGHITLLHVGVLALDVLPGIEPGAAIGPLSTQVGESMRKELDQALHKTCGRARGTRPRRSPTRREGSISS